MPRPTKIVINSTTQEVEIVAMTDEEIAVEEQRKMQIAEAKSARDAELTRIEALKDSARAKLAAGEPLSAEEAELMIP